MRRLRSLLTAIIIVLIALWVVTPIARAMLLLRDDQHPMGNAPIIAGIQSTDAHFYTSDDNPIPIAGWLCVVRQSAPTVILVPGWKEDRTSMLKYASFLVRDSLNVLLIDLQGTGHSGGEFSLGLREPMDVTSAVGYLDDPSSGITNHHYGVLGVSFGAGVALSAAGGNGGLYGGDDEIKAVVADSPWATQDATVDRLNAMSLLGVTIPLPHTVTLGGHHVTFLPGAEWAVNFTLGGAPDTRSALVGARNLAADQSLLVIHNQNDNNPTTTGSDARELFDAAKVKHKFIWVAPLGLHAGAYDAQPEVYQARVLDFFHRYLVAFKDPPYRPVAPTPGMFPGQHGHESGARLFRADFLICYNPARNSWISLEGWRWWKVVSRRRSADDGRRVCCGFVSRYCPSPAYCSPPVPVIKRASRPLAYTRRRRCWARPPWSTIWIPPRCCTPSIPTRSCRLPALPS